MPQSPFAPAESVRQRWQFSIRGMLIFTVSVAIGASVSQTKLSSWVAFIPTDAFDQNKVPLDIKTGWCGGLIATLIFWLCMGIFYQIRDLWASLSTRCDLDNQQRWGRNRVHLADFRAGDLRTLCLDGIFLAIKRRSFCRNRVSGSGKRPT